ncbi:MAG TPA: DUF72 domain-containing protein [Pseudolabrys sp.]|jgi:uncharacterized protein YecE (DUF72 family)|nr:DUF72 domain-containing protein [Pseudolabrys sp.]
MTAEPFVVIARKQAGAVLIGTSGWSYPSWRGPFFPKNVMVKHHLAYYATQFSTAELNGVFYRTPSLDAVRGWREQTPDDFVFAWKASKFITHWKRLSERSVNSLALIEERLNILGAKAGPVLFQLPARFEADHERLASFIKLLPKRRVYAFEFRHRSWYEKDILALLCKHNIALCFSDHRDAPAPWEVTARHIYIRGHGPGGAYKGRYAENTLHDWARRIAAWKSERRTVYVYFDNDQKSAAPADAARLVSLVENFNDDRDGSRGNRPLSSALPERKRVKAVAG